MAPKSKHNNRKDENRIREGDTETLRDLIHEGADVNTPVNAHGTTALMGAASRGRVHCVRLLLEHGAHANRTDNTHELTPLMVASHNGYSDTVGLLLQGGADVHARAVDPVGTSALLMAISQGHTDCVALLLQHGADANTADKRGRNALMKAAHHNHTDCAKLLLKHGADVNAVVSRGWTALMLAARRGHTGVVELLLVNGAQADAAADHGQTALSITAGIISGKADSLKAPVTWTRDNYHVTAQLLLESGANPDRLVNQRSSARSMAPEVMRSLQEVQAQRMREYLCLSSFLEGLIPLSIPKSGAGLAGFLLSDWESTQVAAHRTQLLSDQDAADLEHIGADNAVAMNAPEAAKLVNK